MNKEVIKKYKDVFDYWLDGGKVWFREEHGDWCKYSNPKWEGSLNNHFVQDDQYFKLRKALCDGKVIQGLTIQRKEWVDIKCPSFTDKVTDYRIKPDEPKWYNNESNFPAFVTQRGVAKVMVAKTYEEWWSLEMQGARLATKEEVESLYFKGKDK